MATASTPRARQARDSVVIRFAGDSGDGMQVTGSRFTVETALAGNDLTTFPDFPAEIRAPAGTTYGVSAFQIQFGASDVMTPGDAVDVLVAMNPAALKVELKDLRVGGTILVDTGAFTERNLTKAGFAANPLADGSLAPYQVLTFDITRLTTEAVKPFGLSSREAHRCRNMWALGLMLWMYGRDRQATIEWLRRKFAERAELAQANVAAMNAGHAFGETAEMSEHLVGYTVRSAPVQPGRYRTVSGTEALAWGLIAGMRGAGLEKMIFAGYPITPASHLLHTLANLKAYGVVTFQAEDEIPAINADMSRTRPAKIGGIANGIPPQRVALGDDHGAVAVVGWGSTYGAINRAVSEAREDGADVSHIHLRYLSPFPRNLGDLLSRFQRILVPEMNDGQLVQLLRAAYLVPAQGLSKVAGKPFKVSEIVQAIEAALRSPQSRSPSPHRGEGARG